MFASPTDNAASLHCSMQPALAPRFHCLMALRTMGQREGATMPSRSSRRSDC